jgi:hypothetical protein
MDLIDGLENILFDIQEYMARNRIVELRAPEQEWKQALKKASAALLALILPVSQ